MQGLTINNRNINITVREREIIELIIQEYTSSEIASLLFLSEETIRTHRKTLLRKFRVKNVVGLVRESRTNGIVVIN